MLEIGFIGLGIMGSAMSSHLLKSGIPVLGFDISAQRVREHEKRGGTTAACVSEVAENVDIIVTSLPSKAALDDVLNGAHGICSSTRTDAVIIETSTLSLHDKINARLEAATSGFEMIDCPLSGTGQQALDGDLVAYLSGDEEYKEMAIPVINGFTRAQHDCGDFGNGTLMKLIANHLVAIHNVATAEALLLAKRAGLNLSQVLAAVSDGAGSSRMFEIRGPLMLTELFIEATMRVDTFSKDLSLIRELASETNSPTPLLDACIPVYEDALKEDRGREDTASVFGVLQNRAAGPSA